MLSIKHTSPRRVLSHLRRLDREGKALLASNYLLDVLDDGRWTCRVYDYLRKIVSNPQSIVDTFGLDKPVPLTLNSPTQEEVDSRARRRINDRLITLASMIEKVEAQIESLEH